MATTTDTRWANAVRILGLLVLFLALLATLEARTIRQARAELQTLRTERETAKQSLASAWTHQAVDEFSQAVQAVNEFYGDAADGLGRPGGLCAGGQLTAGPIATYAIGIFLTSRAEGHSVDGSLELMRAALTRSDAYRAAHPDRIPASGGR